MTTVAAPDIDQLLARARYSFPLSSFCGKRLTLPKTFGVYAIRCVDGRIYIGSTSSTGGFRYRLSRHASYLRNGNHISKRLQAAFNEFGADGFQCYILEETSSEDAMKREQMYLDTLQPWDPAIGFNKAKQAQHAMKGRKHSEAAKQRMSIAQKNIAPESMARKRRQFLKSVKEYGTIQSSGNECWILSLVSLRWNLTGYYSPERT